MSRLLLYLPVLACRLMMLLCMAGMRRMGGPSNVPEPPVDAERRIAELERELAALREKGHVGDPADPAGAIAGPDWSSSPGKRVS